MAGTRDADVDIRVLGVLEVDRGSDPVELRAAKVRALLAMLALHPGEVLSADRLTEGLWGDSPPPSAANTLQTYVSQLRRVLGSGAIVTRSPGYVLALPPDAIDAGRFERRVVQGRAALAGGRAREAAERLERALSLWRGPALAEFAYESFAQVEAVRLEELRLVATEELAEAKLALGLHSELVGQLRALVEEHPLRERLWGQLMIALYRSGRQAEALRAFSEVRGRLGEELGISPSPSLQRLEDAMLAQDPELEWDGHRAAGPPPGDASETLAATGPREEDDSFERWRVPLPTLVADVGHIFVGREQEFAELRRAWDETAADHLRVVLVGGEPGVGKTRLAAELARHVYAEGATVLVGRCDEDLGVPYQLFVEPLRHFVDHTPDERLGASLGRFRGELVRLVPELAERVPDLPPLLRSDPETEQYRVFDAVAAWLGEVSTARPLLLVLDDLHWAVKPNLLLLRHVLRSSGLGRLLVVGTYRDTELTRHHPLVELMADLRRGTKTRRLLLDGLTEDGVASYLSEAAGRELGENDRAVARVIHAETQGNALFVREVVRHLVETGAFAEHHGRWDAIPADQLGIPDGVREVVGRRLSRLSDPCVAVLQTASVIGMEFELPVLEAVAALDGDQVVSALDEAISARLVVESSSRSLRFRFTHNLIRDTVYDELSSPRRVKMHRLVADALESVYVGRLDDHLAALAHHHARAAVVGGATQRAVDFARRAGDRAVAQLAHHDAVKFYEQALELLELADDHPDEATRLDLLIRLGDAQRRAGDPAHRETLIGACRLARDQGDADALARAALSNSRGMFAAIGVVDKERVAMLEAALDAHGPAETVVRARLLASLAVELVYAEDRERRYALSAEALSIARRLDEPATLGNVLLARVVAIWGPATVAERLALTAELLDLARDIDDPVLVCSCCWHRSTATTEAGDEAEAEQCLEMAERLAAELGQPTMRWLTTIPRACRDLMVGEITRSENVAAEGYELGRSAGHPDATLYYGILRFNVRFERGDLVDVANDVERIAAANPGVASLRATLALVYGETGQLDKARPLFEELVDQLGDIPQEASWPRAVAQAAMVCARLGDQRRAQVMLELLLPYRGQMICTGVSWVGAVAHYVGILEAVLGRFDDANASLVDAEAAHARVPAPTWLARTRLERARVLLARRAPGDADQARELLGKALDAARRYGLSSVERTVTALLDQTASVVP